jgi:HSP20 family protein
MGDVGDEIEREFQRLRSTMVDMMKTLFHRGRPALVRGAAFEPAVDVFETGSTVIVVMEIAGAERKDIAVELDGRRLRIAGIRRIAVPSDAERCHQMEIDSGAFERWIALNFTPSRDAIEAVYRDGFLRITIHKGAESSARSVRILEE